MSVLKKYFFDSIDSTNEESKRISTSIAQDFVIIADEQTAGRGRRGRSWSSEKHKGLYATYAFYKTKFNSNVALITALSITELLNSKYRSKYKIKWPNDIIINNRKLSGVLIEKNTDYFFIGIGINLFCGETSPITAIALSELENIDEGFFEIRNSLIDEIYLKIVEYKNLTSDELEKLFIQYTLISIGEEISYLKEDVVLSATFIGLGANGELKIRKLNGEEECLISSEVSLNYCK